MFGDTELGKWIAHAMLSEHLHLGARSLEVHDFVRAVECDQGAQSWMKYAKVMLLEAWTAPSMPLALTQTPNLHTDPGHP
jgi:hypothetical protein